MTINTHKNVAIAIWALIDPTATLSDGVKELLFIFTPVIYMTVILLLTCVNAFPARSRTVTPLISTVR